jgi:GNAT superfamily N-acetyltransferase
MKGKIRMNEYIVCSKKNKELIPSLLLNPVYQVYSLYVCETRPEGESVVAINTESKLVEAVLITGKPDLYVAGGYYLSAVNHECAVAVLNTIKEERDTYISYPVFLEKAVRSVFPRGDFSNDYMHVYYEQSEPVILDKCISSIEPATVQPLTKELYEKIEVDDIFYEKVMPTDLVPISKFYGVILNNKLVSIGEYELENSVSCGISQVYTLEEYRGRGYASSLIRSIAEQIRSKNKIPVYHFSETNIASRKACEHASFQECIKLGFMEM